MITGTYFFKTSVIISVLEYDILESWDLIKMRFSYLPLKFSVPWIKLNLPFLFVFSGHHVLRNGGLLLEEGKTTFTYCIPICHKVFPKGWKKTIGTHFGRLGHIVLFILTKAVNVILNRRGRYRYWSKNIVSSHLRRLQQNVVVNFKIWQ